MGKFEDKRNCKICGREFIATHNRTLCCGEECSRINKVTIERLKKQKRMAVRNVTKKRQEIADINARAKEAGMSYGQYVAMMEIKAGDKGENKG